MGGEQGGEVTFALKKDGLPYRESSDPTRRSHRKRIWMR